MHFSFQIQMWKCDCSRWSRYYDLKHLFLRIQNNFTSHLQLVSYYNLTNSEVFNRAAIRHQRKCLLMNSVVVDKNKAEEDKKSQSNNQDTNMNTENKPDQEQKWWDSSIILRYILNILILHIYCLTCFNGLSIRPWFLFIQISGFFVRKCPRHGVPG